MNIIKAGDYKYKESLLYIWNKERRMLPDYQYDLWEYYYVTFSERQLIDDISFIVINDDGIPVVSLQGFIQQRNSNAVPPGIIICSGELLTKRIKKVFIKNILSLLKKNQMLCINDYFTEGHLSLFGEMLCLNGAHIKAHIQREIDLSYNENVLWGKIRKSYKPLINSDSSINVEVLHENNLNKDIFDMFHELHIKESGRETRSKNTWDLQYKMILNRSAFLVTGFIDNVLVTGALFVCTKTDCNYHVSVSRRDLFNNALSHKIIWAAIRYSKSIGIKYFVMGEQVYRNHPIIGKQTKKEIGISHFKSGFGGKDKVYIRMHMGLGGEYL